MKRLTRVTTVLLAVVMLLAMSLPAFAAVDDTGFTDVAADAWYADAVEYVRDKGLMSGTGADTFSPEATTSRGQIAAILYRAAGSPAVTGDNPFPDVESAAYYTDAARWASASGIISGYSNGNFGPNDPITREQFAAILWRYAGSPAADAGEDFADEDTIFPYASTAVDWARANGIINGKEGNRFDPDDSATRAQAAVILRNYMELEAGQAAQPDGSRVLVVYYSATGSTEAVAQTIANTLGGDLFELVPTDPYTSADLDWTADGSRVNREHDDEALRDIALTSTEVEDWEDYDTVFIGYPIWWGIAAWPVDAFIKANDFTGKTVIPFCTSASSGLGRSGELLEEMAGTGNWLDGQRFSSGASSSAVDAWVNGLRLPAVSDSSNETNHSTLVVYFSMPETMQAGNMTTEEDNSTVVIDG